MKRAGLAVALLLAAIGIPQAAQAACHIAEFGDDSVDVAEAAGTVTLTVVLVGGQPTCSGTVDYQTQNGTARAGSDYTARSGTLTFTTGDDRQETIAIPITADDVHESDETFTVRIFNATGNISANDTATVTIEDDDPSPQPVPTKTTNSQSPSPTQSPSASPSPTETPTTASPSPTESPSPSESPTVQATPLGGSGDGGNPGLIAALIAAILLGGAGGIWLFRRRAAG